MTGRCTLTTRPAGPRKAELPPRDDLFAYQRDKDRVAVEQALPMELLSSCHGNAVHDSC